MNKFIDKYYGPYKITDTAVSDSKTYSGKGKVVLICSGKAIELPVEVAEIVVTPEKIDLTELRELRVIPVVEQLLQILVESELSQADLDYATGPKLSASLNASFQKASEILWGKDKNDITLMDIQTVLTKHDDAKHNTKDVKPK